MPIKITIDETLPDAFYKFTSAERAIEIVKNKQLWFSSPKNFNDPFDCNINLIDFQPSEEQIKTVINEKVQRNRKTRRQEIQKNKRNAYRIRNQFAEQLNEMFQNSGICCFSEKYENILLWSHYAENHRGICLGFNRGISKIATMSGKVQYRDNYEKALFFGMKGEAIYHLVFTKSKDWSYEQEIRAVRILSNGKTDFDICHLTEIIFGCKTEKSVIQEMKKIIFNLGTTHINFKQAKQTKSSFNLSFE
jgi:hypothetical protein